MNGILHQLGITLRLQYRNKTGLLYGYLFPTIFLVAFWVLYRYEQVPLARHMGELLTVTALGGACFGLPTSMVGERERGVWRRYRLAPVPTGSLVASTVVARYFLLVTAGLLQIALAIGIGMPLPRHPIGLWVAFTFVSFAFLGLGLVIAMLADNVPAVQALGQSIFLPMLIIGGVAVRLESLPAWAQHLSAFFPGRYAVQALQACVTGSGLEAARFSLLALLLIGAAGCLAGAKMFRWEAQQRFAAREEKGWVAVALAAWVAVGLMAESRGLIAAAGPAAPDHQSAHTAVAEPEARADTPATLPAATAQATDTSSHETSVALPSPDTAGRVATPPAAMPEAAAFSAPAGTWQAVTVANIDELDFERLPPDEGVVAPIARADEQPPYAGLAREIECVRRMLPEWRPGQVDDPVQRVRNYLYVATVPDIFQMESLEPWVPRVVFERLRRDIPRDQLVKILYWIATHPSEGDHSAAGQLRAACIDTGGRPTEVELLRERTAIYAVKLLGRLTGKIVPG
jgi:ABC-type transport system involved in cytochrome c biogenesis permease component